ncbi:Paclitaxel/taxanoid biosynthesis susceptibility protein TS1 [Bacillus pseudomycoides]|uniref:RNA-guided endonuclease IscB n=1 Tax=Bacillus pseudomycoides TaxID=64104 RepID=UPI000BECDBE0|nr:RNA-guided endonuclease IscB [Bacillus pseudomycoides]PEF72879.1 Paclitaxel/taxanoid biosynthesis susceptibility protein TS1 [Bacillus pseudomycoides]PEL77897.1 Paclitaxel/taxanoid biosynthesis susceptibility protein TS1 [Bacillus pseudomycoides]
MRVFVKNLRGEPLMPCSNRKARLLLKQGKAKIIGYTPFTIQLQYATGETVQSVAIGVDSGSKYVGIAITTEDKVLAKGTIELRQDVKENLTMRATLRRSRRQRKTRYRKARFLNRKKREGWLPPSIQSRMHNQIHWIEIFRSLLPSPKVIVEVGKFDAQKLKNSDIQGKEYQQGDAFGFWNTRYYVFTRDHYTCQICKKKGGILHTHHIIERCSGGSDMADNLVTVHEECHQKFHQGTIKHIFKKPKQYKETAFMNILRLQIMNRLGCEITYGSYTTPKRKELRLSKTHYNDAIAITTPTKLQEYEQSGEFRIKQFRKKKRSLHESTARKGRKTKNTTAKRNNKNTPKVHGIYLGDKVKVFGQVGFVTGFTGKMMYVQDIDGHYLQNPSKSYKQVKISDIECIHHNNNWLFLQIS